MVGVRAYDAKGSMIVLNDAYMVSCVMERGFWYLNIEVSASWTMPCFFTVVHYRVEAY